MKENTQEKKLTKRNKNSIVYKIKKFFMKLFNKKDVVAENIEEQQESTRKNNSAFKDNMKVEELNDNKVLELQQKYRNGIVSVKELTNEEIDKLCDLYDEQIEKLKKEIKAKSGAIEEYKKRKKYRFKKNNA